MRRIHSALLGLVLMPALTPSVFPKTKTCRDGSACCNGGACRSHHQNKIGPHQPPASFPAAERSDL